jgi:acetyltransferase-like isoleucine patch superfamily enzyme
MTAFFLVGAAKFAVDISGIVEAGLRALGEEPELRGFLAVAGEETAADPARTQPFDAGLLESSRVVVAVADPKVRARLFADHLDELRAAALTVVHPTAILAPGCCLGAGNLVGPHCYLGTNVSLGDLNVLNYHVGIGHHTQIGDCNFIAPGFQCGNSVVLGDGNFFGLSCTVGPGITIRDNNRFQAGAIVTQPIASHLLCYSSERLKAVQLPGDEHGAG